MGEKSWIEIKARNFIENVLIPEVKRFETVTKSVKDFIKYGVNEIIGEISCLVKEYGLCLKIIYEPNISMYQFWFENK